MNPYTWFVHTKQPTGTPQVWRDEAAFRSFFESPIYALDKASLPGWSPYMFKGNRRSNANAIVSWFLVYDVDEPFDDIEVFSALVRMAFAACAVVHTTFSSKSGALKARVIVRLARPVTPEEFRLLWSYGRRALSLQGVTVDDACKDVARLHYAPAKAAGGLYEVRFIEGPPLAVEAPIAYQRSILEGERREREARAKRFNPERLGHAGLEKILKRAIAAVVSASAGERHRTLLIWTFRLAELRIAKVTVERAMFSAGCNVCGEARRGEVARTVRYAIENAGKR